MIGNLEGPIAEDSDHLLAQKVVFNHRAVLDYLRNSRFSSVSLANNHTMDVAGTLAATIDALTACGVVPVGAGLTAADAAVPGIVKEDGTEVVLLAFGWEVIGCQPAGGGRSGVNPLRTDHVLRSVEMARSTHPGLPIVVLPHWNYELELYPMPMHRQLAFELVDAGASAVIGCHTHCVQGVEVYKGAPIVYGLGNWFLAQGLFFGGKLRFPDLAREQLAFQWNPQSGNMACHWFEYEPAEQQLSLRLSEPLEGSSRVAELTPFNGMSHRDYVRWFRAHRRKRALLPVYSSPHAPLTNWLRDAWVGQRQHLIDLAFRLKLKGGPQ